MPERFPPTWQEREGRLKGTIPDLADWPLENRGYYLDREGGVQLTPHSNPWEQVPPDWPLLGRDYIEDAEGVFIWLSELPRSPYEEDEDVLGRYNSTRAIEDWMEENRANWTEEEYRSIYRTSKGPKWREENPLTPEREEAKRKRRQERDALHGVDFSDEEIYEAKSRVQNYDNGGGVNTLPEDQEVPISGIASFTPKPRYEYGLVEEQLAPYSLNRLLQAFVPARQEVLEEPETQYRGAWDDVRLDEEGRPIIEREVKPGEYGEREWHPGYAPAVRAVEKGLGVVGEVMQDPSMIPRGIAKLPEFADAFMQQLRGSAQTATQGRLEGYDPETGGEFRAEDIMSMAPVTMGAGTAMSIARTAPTGEVVGIFGGRSMKSYPAKEKVLKKMETEYEGTNRSLDTIKQEQWDRQQGQKLKIYRSAADDKPRIEMKTVAGAKLKKDAFDIEDTPEIRRYGGDPKVSLKVDPRHITGETELMLGDILDFPTLYKEYNRTLPGRPTAAHYGDYRMLPRVSEKYRPISKMGIRILNPEEGAFGGRSLGQYEPLTDTIALGTHRGLNEMKRSVLHEVQHAIQAREGFYGGGGQASLESIKSIRMHKEIDLENLANRLFENDLNIKQRMGRLGVEPQVLDGMAMGGRKGQQMVDDILGEGMYARIRLSIPRAAPDAIKNDLEKLAKLQRELRAVVQAERESQKYYWRNPGEVEARNAALRSSKPSGGVAHLLRKQPPEITLPTPQDFKSIHPELTADYFPEEMVYSIRSGQRPDKVFFGEGDMGRSGALGLQNIMDKALD